MHCARVQSSISQIRQPTRATLHQTDAPLRFVIIILACRCLGTMALIFIHIFNLIYPFNISLVKTSHLALATSRAQRKMK